MLRHRSLVPAFLATGLTACLGVSGCGPSAETQAYDLLISGMAKVDKGAYGEAIRDFTRSIELKPDLSSAYYNRGVAYGKKGDHDRAIQDYTKAIELEPDFAEPYNNRGTVYARNSEYDRAIQDYTKAIELKPDYAEARSNRAAAHYFRKAYDKAWADVKKCRQLGGTPSRKLIEQLTKDSGRSE
jgi:tetratricopeptide (TPR) repeat protein